MAKVSIIIPTYNVEMYLVECMDSVVRQTLKDIEIICINDGSTDRSLEILKSYAEKDDRVIIVDKENGGYGKAMNIGLDKATGEYIGIVEPDDFVPLNMYEDLYETAVKNELDFVKADFYRFKRAKNGNMELTYNHLSKHAEDYNVVFDPSQTPSAIRFIMNTWSGIYKREFIEKYHIRHNETPGASFQDNGFFFQTFIYATRAMILDKPFYMNRRDNPNSSVHSREKVYCINEEYDFIREILMENKELWHRFKYIYWDKKYSNYKATMQRIGNEYKREYILHVSREFKRANDKGELKQEEFTEERWQEIQFLIADPEGFYYSTFLSVIQKEADKEELKAAEEQQKQNKKELMIAQKEIKKIKNSTSYRLGFWLTALPRNLKKMWKSWRKSKK